jgi:hypothetical protein
MTLDGVSWVFFAALLGTAVSPATARPGQPGDTGGETIGVVWHDQATVDPAFQQRLVDALTRQGGSPRPVVVGDASTVARARVALELPRARVEVAVAWRARLDEATAAYRGGQLAAARVAVSGVLEAVRGDPVVPGAAALAWRAHVLRAQLSWTEGDAAGLEEAIAAAVALDPGAKPSTRQVPPPVVDAYLRRRDAVVAGADAWPSLAVMGAPGEPFAVEIDGVPGRRAVPPGEHLVVVRRLGVAPVGAVVRTGAPYVIPAAEVVLPPGLPPDEATAERICEAAEVEWLLLARLRDDRLGLQRYGCGEGFFAAWYEGRDGWSPGVELVLGVERGLGGEPALDRMAPWPAVPPAMPPRPTLIAAGTSGADRGRLRRALPWLLIGGAIAGAVTVGVLVAGEPNPSLAIDGNGFLRP